MQVHYSGGTVNKIPVTLNDHSKTDTFAIIRFDRFQVFAESADDAHAVIVAGIEALRLLDPDMPPSDVVAELLADCTDAEEHLPGAGMPLTEFLAAKAGAS